MDDRIGATIRYSEIADMLDYLDVCHLIYVKASGRYFTWNHKQEGEMRVFSRIADRVLANSAWNDRFSLAKVGFLPEGNYDHSIISLICVYPEIRQKKPLRFYNTWCSHTYLVATVRNACNHQQVVSCPMYKICEKLKLVKQALKVLNRDVLEMLRLLL